MIVINKNVSTQQRKLFLKLFVLMMFLILGSWITTLSLISDTLASINFPINGYCLWLSYVPMIFIFIGYLRNRPIIFDWAGLYSLAIPLSFVSLTYSLVNIYVYVYKPLNYIVSGSFLITFIIIFFVKIKRINFKLVKKNLLEFYIDEQTGCYAPKPTEGGIGSLYIKVKEKTRLDKIKYAFFSIILVIGPLLVGANISSAADGMFKIIMNSLFMFFISVIVGIYLLHLCFARLKCLYQIQKELGCKLRFGE